MAKVKKKLFLIETLVQYKMLYVIESEDDWVSDEEFHSLLDTGKVEELDQKFLGEGTVNTKTITPKQFEKLCKISVNGHMKDKMIYKNALIAQLAEA